MKFLSRVVWSEGMYLAPHHFQSQSRYFEDSVAFLASTVSHEPYGLLHFEMDTKAVANGTVSLLYASGIFPDGLAFEMPTSDPRPPTRTLASLCEPSDAELRLHLAVPARVSNNVADYRDEAAKEGRYSVETRTLRDETNGLDEYDVEFARKNIVLLAERELTPAWVSFPIAQLVRNAKGQFQYDHEFVPCSLRVTAGEALPLLLTRLLEVVAEKSAAIARPVHSRKQLQLQSMPLEVANYWFLHALHSALPPIRHLLHARHTHPSDCFIEVARLAGALCSFSIDSDPRTLPLYDHLDPGPAFRYLFMHIQQQLEIVVPSNTVHLAFTLTEPYVYTAPITDERCLRRSRWVLGIRSSLGESEQLRLVPRLVKVCSARFVPELVRRALPGLTLTHLPVPPTALRAEVDMRYFSIDNAGPCWDHILQTRQSGIYIPGEIANAEFSLTVILEQS